MSGRRLLYPKILSRTETAYRISVLRSGFEPNITSVRFTSDVTQLLSVKIPSVVNRSQIDPL